MLGRTLVTAQTGPAGKQVNRIYLEEGATIVKEFYLSLLVDRSASRVAFVVSTEGGMDIEEVAHHTPEQDHQFHGRSGDRDHAAPRPHGRQAPSALPGDLAKQAEKLTAQLYTAFVAKDMAMLEINPLIVSAEGQLKCLDAKIVI